MLRTMLAAMLPLCLGLTTICAPNARATPVPDDLGDRSGPRSTAGSFSSPRSGLT